MSQVMEAEILKPSLIQRFIPSCVAIAALDGCAHVGKADFRMFPQLFFQYQDCIIVQRYASRRSILGLIEPCGTT